MAEQDIRSPADADAAGYQRRLADLIGAYRVSAAIGAFARLGVADALADGPATAAELAARVGAEEGALTRLLDATLETGLFALDADGRYRLTALGELLRSDAPGSMRRYAAVSTDQWRWYAYGHLTHTLRTGEPGLLAAHGSRFWDYLATHPEAAASFEESLARIGAARDNALAAAIDLGGSRCVVDVGGRRGGLLSALLAERPHLRGILFDLPGVVEGAHERLREAGLAEHCEVVGGDFREGVPPGGDVYILSWILHDWDDPGARRILTRCRDAMDEGARLLVVEMVVPRADEPTAPAFGRLVRQADLEMLAVVGGRERTAVEFERLLEGAGFALAGIVPLTGMPWSVLEATAV